MSTSRALLPNLFLLHYTSHLPVDHVGSAFRLYPESNHFTQLPPWSATLSLPDAGTSLPCCPGFLQCGLHTQPAGLSRTFSRSGHSRAWTSSSFSIICTHSPSATIFLLRPHPCPSSHTGLLAVPCCSHLAGSRLCPNTLPQVPQDSLSHPSGLCSNATSLVSPP